jgi:hypothetical protein
MAHARPAAAPLKSALRIATQPGTASGAALAGAAPAAVPACLRASRTLSPEDLRQMMIGEFTAWLGTQVSPKVKRPYQPHTITNYADAAKTLGRWMTSEKIDGDFAACDTALLNRFFARYLAIHTQGGTNTLQRNLAHLFGWLEQVYGHPSPYADPTLRSPWPGSKP